MPSPEALDTHVAPGISLAFALIFFAPLAVVVLGFMIYSAVTRRSIVRAARILSVLWLLACVPATLMIFMGHAFNSSKMHPVIAVPLWVVIGLAAVWLPVAMRVVFRVKPV
jgi:hypothetical protein